MQVWITGTHENVNALLTGLESVERKEKTFLVTFKEMVFPQNFQVIHLWHMGETKLPF